MTLESALAENTAALKEVAELLKQSNEARAKIMADANIGGMKTPTPSSAGSDTDMSVADIKTNLNNADLATMKAMLEAEENGKKRSTAIKAITEAIAAAEGNAGPTADATPTPAETTTSAPEQQTAQAASPSDKNAEPVPAGVTGELAAKTFGAYFAETDDEQERANRREFTKNVIETLGSKIGELSGDDARKAVFFLRRQRGGLPVDFSAAYDFDGSPMQELGAAPAASVEDELL
ncbi:hypothetical protein [Alterisphingorhabdus coralli]|uniref:Uncharacterized protein n=1 Tax=Alterisphingorhabdus coralli TaxID=3071408 RepID=A0AA97F8F8_9SPHN|nr:hypothetical protein [Parasphingorhabdus sp. SCSIO 66989]WOE76364.1 hypothetical protein RB602_06525 [Parasphingorhabdus sp. SCSIO 66989]